MKKSIRPISILRIIWLAIWIFFIGLSISAMILIIVEGEYDLFEIFSLILSIPLCLISLFIFCSDFKKGIKFEESSLKVSADVADKRGLLIRRFQHKLEVNYKDIQKLYLIYSSNDSHDKPVNHVFVAMPYICMDCKDGSRQLINVYYYNKNQRMRILNEIKLRAGNVGNLLECDV